jgi:hypothetical protein
VAELVQFRGEGGGCVGGVGRNDERTVLPLRSAEGPVEPDGQFPGHPQVAEGLRPRPSRSWAAAFLARRTAWHTWRTLPSATPRSRKVFNTARTFVAGVVSIPTGVHASRPRKQFGQLPPPDECRARVVEHAPFRQGGVPHEQVMVAGRELQVWGGRLATDGRGCGLRRVRRTRLDLCTSRGWGQAGWQEVPHGLGEFCDSSVDLRLSANRIGPHPPADGGQGVRERHGPFARPPFCPRPPASRTPTRGSPPSPG